MRDGFEDALRHGTCLAFMGANTCYWQVRHEDGERTLVEYRDNALDPEPDRALKTIRFRDLTPARPERDLIGQQYEGGLGSPSAPRDFRFVPGFATDPWAAGVELAPERPLERLVGYEWDTLGAGSAARAHPDPALRRDAGPRRLRALDRAVGGVGVLGREPAAGLGARRLARTRGGRPAPAARAAGRVRVGARLRA